MPSRIDQLADRIVKDPAILVGKPTIRGTRISVELVLEKLAVTPSIDALLADYPHLTREDIQACLAYAHVLVRRQRKAKPSAPISAAAPAARR